VEEHVSVTLLYLDQHPRVAATAEPDGDDLWIPLDELEAFTGWELRPEGVCRGEQCVPIPDGREDEFVRDVPAAFNIAALARWLGQPVVHDPERRVWLFGEAAGDRRHQRQSLQAPDFTLPDLDGNLHSLSDYRGRKVFLVSWASW
jgi:hypothetical protein